MGASTPTSVGAFFCHVCRGHSLPSTWTLTPLSSEAGGETGRLLPMLPCNNWLLSVTWSPTVTGRPNQPNSGRKWPLLPSQTTQHSASALSEVTHTGRISRSFPTEVPHFIFLSLKSFSKVQVRVKESFSPLCVELPLGCFLIFPVLPNSGNRENLIFILAKYPPN